MVAATAGIVGGSANAIANAQDGEPIDLSPPASGHQEHQHQHQHQHQQHNAENVQDEFDGFSRMKPSRGNDPDSDYYCGKLVPGFRSADAPPVPITAPDLESLPFKMVNGAKEFQVRAQSVAS